MCLKTQSLNFKNFGVNLTNSLTQCVSPPNYSHSRKKMACAATLECAYTAHKEWKHGRYIADLIRASAASDRTVGCGIEAEGRKTKRRHEQPNNPAMRTPNRVHRRGRIGLRSKNRPSK